MLDERLAALIDGDTSDARLSAHVSTCTRCARALASLEAQRSALSSLGDVPGAEPSDAGFRNVMASLAHERAARRPRLVLAWSFAAATVMLVGGFGLRQLLMTRARQAEDSAIVSGADAAFRRAEREYTEAVTLLRDRLSVQRGGTIDPAVEQGSRVLAEARRKASELARGRRADPAREALLHDALRAEVRFYEDALLRAEASVEPRP